MRTLQTAVFGFVCLSGCIFLGCGGEDGGMVPEVEQSTPALTRVPLPLPCDKFIEYCNARADATAKTCAITADAIRCGNIQADDLQKCHDTYVEHCGSSIRLADDRSGLPH
jgi:hypothetical protein